MKKIIIISFLLVFIASAVLPLETFANHASSSLRRKINKLDDDRVENVPMPILFGLTPENMTSDFGDPRSGGRRHEGQDVLAPIGAPIVSPTEGVVISVGKGDSSGYYVYTANPGDETFVYMHLNKMSELDEGDVLSKGDLIGYIGNTGNASGGVAHLHFEIHDEDGDATDPFPRIRRIFPLADKMKYLQTILDDLDNADAEKVLAEFLVRAYRREFILANTLNIPLPAIIQTYLVTIPISTPIPTSYTNISNNPNNTLRLGSSGPTVVTLQKFLLSKNAGVNNAVVATGNFDARTEKALSDYQRDVGLVADGVYGPLTRVYIAAHP